MSMSPTSSGFGASVATGVAAAGVVSALYASFLLHALRAISPARLTTASDDETRTDIIICSSCGGKVEHLARLNQIRILDRVAIGGIDRVPLLGVAKLAL